MTEENKNLLKAPNKLVITGKGRWVLAYDLDGVECVAFAAVTSDLKILLGGKDVTDKVKMGGSRGFMQNKIIAEIDQQPPNELPVFEMLKMDICLPPSVFTLPEDFNPDKIELIKINDDFEELRDGGIWVDYILYDGEELEADTLYGDYYGDNDFTENNTEYKDTYCDYKM